MADKNQKELSINHRLIDAAMRRGVFNPMTYSGTVPLKEVPAYREWKQGKLVSFSGVPQPGYTPTLSAYSGTVPGIVVTRHICPHCGHQFTTERLSGTQSLR